MPLLLILIFIANRLSRLWNALAITDLALSMSAIIFQQAHSHISIVFGLVTQILQVQYSWLTLSYKFHMIAVKKGCTRYAVTSNQRQYYHSISVQNVCRH